MEISDISFCVCFRTGIVIREATKIWNGNENVYFKNERTKLQLEELATKPVDMCSIPEIGFGYGKYNFLLLIINL